MFFFFEFENCSFSMGYYRLRASRLMRVRDPPLLLPLFKCSSASFPPMSHLPCHTSVARSKKQPSTADSKCRLAFL